MSILLIDDDPELIDFLTRIIQRALPGHTLHTALDGIRGVQLALQHRATLKLLVLDARMPSLDGQLVAAFLRWACPTVPIIPLSGDPRTASTFAALGCLPSLPKGSAAPIYQHAIAQALQTSVTAPMMTALHWTMVEQVRQMVDAGDAGLVVVERHTLQRLMTSLNKLARRTTIASRELDQSLKELRRVM